MPRLAFFGALLIAAPVLATAQEGHLAPLPPALPRTHTPQPTTSAITAADLMTRLYIFADDSMQGREIGLIGNARGTTYLAAEVRRLGLTPAGDSGTFFQYAPGFSSVLVANDASMRIGGTALVLQQDFLPVGIHSLKRSALATVYGGRVEAPVTLTAQQATGKLVVFTTSNAFVSDSLALLHPFPQVAGAAAIAIVALDSIAPATRARAVLGMWRSTRSPTLL